MSTDMSQHLYARGFQIARFGAHRAPAGFRTISVGDWDVSYEARTVVSHQEADGFFVVVIGYAVDIADGHDDGTLLARKLLEQLRVSEKHFFAGLDHLGGRYAVFYGTPAGASILGDACATRTIFYARSEPFVASHQQLVASACGGGDRSDHWLVRRHDRNRHTAYGYPAGTTPHRNVGLLLCNMVLRLDTMRYERFYPREALQSRSLGESVATLAKLFRRQLEILVRRHRIVCSLTAGLDSRCTLAALRPFLQQSRFFTYATQEGHQVDAALASVLARRHGLAHELMETPDTGTEQFEAFRKVLDRNNYHPHNRAAAFGYLSLFRPGDIHIRSTMYEVARAFYRSSRERPESLDAEGMAKLYYKHYSESDGDLVAAFQGYIDQSDFVTGLHNYDPYDLFYLEQRMSCWHALVLLEADPSVDTYMLMSSRACLEAGLALSRSERVSASVFKGMIREWWPELLDAPVNPKSLALVPAE